VTIVATKQLAPERETLADRLITPPPPQGRIRGGEHPTHTGSRFANAPPVMRASSAPGDRPSRPPRAAADRAAATPRPPVGPPMATASTGIDGTAASAATRQRRSPPRTHVQRRGPRQCRRSQRWKHRGRLRCRRAHSTTWAPKKTHAGTWLSRASTVTNPRRWLDRQRTTNRSCGRVLADRVRRETLGGAGAAPGASR